MTRKINDENNIPNPFHGDNIVNTTEFSFQQSIIDDLLNLQKYRESKSKDFDREFCINQQQLLEFIETTQPGAFQSIQKRGLRPFLVRIDDKMNQKGIIAVLRKGVKYKDQNIHLFYPQPASIHNPKDEKNYAANIFSVTPELVYSTDTKNRNRIDLVIFLNGLPIITMELKDGFQRQSVTQAIEQYRTNRNPKDKIFKFNRCLVHFAVDTGLVFMTTHLKGQDTQFLPFNKGQNDGRPHAPFGAGNPKDPTKNSIITSYLWNEVLSKDSLANIIQNFVQVESKTSGDQKKKKEYLIFPRYHQLTAVRQILADVKQNGPGQRYLIQHSAGSGKSYTITWLALQLSNLYDNKGTSPVFDTTVVVTDRKVLDQQLKKTIRSFNHIKGLVEAIDGSVRNIKSLNPAETSFSKTTHITYALENSKKIIICTIQTFPYALEAARKLQKKKIAFIIDEAHSSQSGESSAKMNALFAGNENFTLERDEGGNYDSEDLVNYIIQSKKMLENASYFAFTATPKNKTLETFGEQDYDGKFYPFHLYSMQQAIEEEFILDVLSHYTTYKSYYQLVKKIKDNPYFETREAHKKLRAYVEAHPLAIAEKAKVMIDHFHNEVAHLINHRARAMVVVKSIEAAIKYKDAFDEYLQEIRSPYKAIVAFSGKKKHPSSGIEVDEAAMNNFPDGDNNIVRQFENDQYRFLIAAEKFQTGFDQPLLHTMYVDKKLTGLQAVQTLSRLNRAYPPYKHDTFILDFYNKAEDIRNSFNTYYTSTILSEKTNADQLNDLEDDLAEYELYSEDDVEQFFTIYYSKFNEKNSLLTVTPARTMAQKDQELTASLRKILSRVIERFDEELDKERKALFKKMAQSFVHTYSYLVKILDFKKPYWEKLWLFLKHLLAMVKLENDKNFNDIINAVNLDTYRLHILDTKPLFLSGGEEIAPVSAGVTVKENEEKYDTLDNILVEFNRRFSEWIRDEKSAQVLAQIPLDMLDDDDIMNTILNSDQQNARDESDEKLDARISSNVRRMTDIYKKYFDNPEFKESYRSFVFQILWHKKQALESANRAGGVSLGSSSYGDTSRTKKPKDKTYHIGGEN